MDRDDKGRFISTSPQPYVEIGSESAEAMLVASGPMTHEQVLAAMGLDADHWDVKELKRRVTTTADGETRESLSVTAKRVVSDMSAMMDMSELNSMMDRWVMGTPHKEQRAAGKAAKASYLLFLADWQMGSATALHSSRDIVARVQAATDAAVEHLKSSMTDYNITTVYIFGLGDIIENCKEFYASQLFTIDMTLRDQIRTSYQLIVAAILKLYTVVPHVVLVPVGGNHGEASRSGGRNTTDTSDNHDLLVFDMAYDMFSDRPDFNKVEIVRSENPLYNVVDVGGVRVGITHGHLFRTGSGAEDKALRWWRNQAFARTPLNSVDILVTGHFHSFKAAEFADKRRTWFQAPAMDNGSTWFTDSSGLSAPPGTLAFVAGSACGVRGWDNLKLL